jgi:replicative DNA helicase
MNEEEEKLVEAEFLGCLIKDNEQMDSFFGQFDKNDFIHHTHFLIWEAISRLYEDSVPITPMSIHETNKKIERSYLVEMRGHVTSPHLAKFYSEKLKVNSAYRKMQAYAMKLMNIVSVREKQTPEDLMSEADGLLLRMRKKETNSMRSVKDMKKSFEAHLSSNSVLIKTGRPAYDKQYGGIPRKALYILSGRTHVGKTAEAVQMAYHMAKQGEGAVLFWSQEMTENDVLERLTSNVSGVGYRNITRQETSEEDKAKVLSALDLVATFPLYIDDTPRVRIGTVKATAHMFKRKYGKLAALFVDYLSMMDIEQNSNQSFPKAVGEVAFQAKALAKELDCPVIILAQINRAATGDDRPDSHHLKESGDIEQAADFIEILWKESKYQTPELGYEVITSTIAKGRKGGKGEFLYKFTGGVQRYEDYEAPKQTESYEPNNDGLVAWSKGKGRKRA